MVKNKIVIGIDQSYKCTGVTAIKDGIEILSMDGIRLEQCEDNTERRVLLKKKISNILFRLKYVYDDSEMIIIVERIRLRSQGFLSEAYIKSIGALTSVIIDTAKQYNIPVYSVDTRSWKSQIVGTSKPLDNPYGINKEKYPTILYLKSKGLLNRLVEPYSGKGKKGIIPVRINGEKVPCKINDDIADSYCICMYGFIPKTKQKLKEERF